jgi:hypothetical protein
MAGRIILGLLNPALDSNSDIDDGATITFYENHTTVPQSIYDSINLDDALPNPLSPDAAGRFPPIWAPDGSVFSVKWTMTNGDVITWDDIYVDFSSSGGSGRTYDIDVYFNSMPEEGETFPIKNCQTAFTFPEDLVGSLFSVHDSALPTATATFTLFKNADSIGTIAFGTDGAATVTFSDAVDFNIGDQFILTAPDPQDATMNFISLNFKGSLL